MFKRRAFANAGPRENRTLVDIGRKMVAQCKGVPLAIKSLGGLLHSKQHESEWELIEKTEMWKSLANEDGILPVLRLSYDHLPSPCLKLCFAFCSFFPKDFEIQKDELICRWMGQGYLQSSSRANSKMEDVGNEYCNILLRNSLLQDVKLDWYKNIQSFKMHDLVHDLAMDVSDGSCLTLKASEVRENSDVQHLKLHLEEGEGFENLKDGKRLRTLSLTGHIPKDFKNVKHIRSLTLEMPHVKKLPPSMHKLKHLRYLDLSQTSIQKLPNYISSFYNLQILRLPYFKLKEYELHKLMPKNIGQLTSLQTLPFFAVGKDNNIEELRSLSQLRGPVYVYGLQHVKDNEEAEKSKMQDKLGITKLGLIWDGYYGKSNVNHEDVLQGLKPGMNVKNLFLKNFGGQRLASWMRGDGQFLTNLVNIELRNCYNCEQLPRIGHLPHLEVVVMEDFHNLKRIGPDFYGLDELIVGDGSSSTGAAPTQVFPAFRILRLGNMPQLKEWSDRSSLPIIATSTMEFFPRLEGVWILGCSQLITIPSDLLSIQGLFIASGSYTGQLRTYKPHMSLTADDSANNAIIILMAELLEKTCKSLRTLEIKNFHELCYLPNQLLVLSSLERLRITDCPDLVYIDEDKEAALDRLTSLQELCISGCHNLRCLPKGLLQPTLETLDIWDCPKLEMAHPDELCTLTSLRDLHIVWCPELKNVWEDGLLCHTNLQRLEIGGFSKELEYLPWPSSCASSADAAKEEFPFISLQSLTLWGPEKLKYLPDQLQHLTTLTELRILSFEGLEDLPEWLGNLSALQTLELVGCSSLRNLTSLETIINESGNEYPRISRGR